MADRGRGGYRKPARPAAVSTPRSGARTDGGPADKQPVRVASGGKYGERQASENLQSSAPLEAGGLQAPPQEFIQSQMGNTEPELPPQGEQPVDVFGASKRPTDQIVGSQGQVPSADLTIRELVRNYPSPWMMRLLRRNSG